MIFLYVMQNALMCCLLHVLNHLLICELWCCFGPNSWVELKTLSLLFPCLPSFSSIFPSILLSFPLTFPLFPLLPLLYPSVQGVCEHCELLDGI